jgi:hypothetical protein
MVLSTGANDGGSSYVYTHCLVTVLISLVTGSEWCLKCQIRRHYKSERSQAGLDKLNRYLVELACCTGM